MTRHSVNNNTGRVLLYLFGQIQIIWSVNKFIFQRRHFVYISLSLPRANKWYSPVWYHVCSVAWLKITKLCQCLSYFLGLFAILKVWKFVAFGAVFWRQRWLHWCMDGIKVTTLMCGWSKLRSKQIKLIWRFASFKADNVQKPCLSLKSDFFHYFIGLWI